MIVATRQGPVAGREEHGTHVFRGIPYASPPVGARRWRAPEPPSTRAHTLDCDRFRPAAPQVASTLYIASLLAGPGLGGADEDCLYLNLWTPAADSRRRPVLVWIHGGGFVLGSSSPRVYDGSRLARRGDVVVVTLNYRLGALGFLALDAVDGTPAGDDTNFGLRDQIAALAWVRDNIENFGGDPDNITLFGESAGGMSIGTLLGVPAARGLFRRAILQSGAASNVSTRARAHGVAEHFLANLPQRPRDVDELRQFPVEAVLEAQRATSMALSLRQGSLPWQPHVDGSWLPERPLRRIDSGEAAAVDVLLGTNHDEWNIFMLADPKGRRLDEPGLERRYRRFEAMAHEHEDATTLEAVQRARARRQTARSAASAQWRQFQSERVFHLPATHLADAHAATGGRTFVYRFDHAHPLVGRWLGACHGFELPFVFGTLGDPLLGALFAATPTARGISHRMMDAWLAFARHGDPNHAGLPAWPAYHPQSPAAMAFAHPCRLVGSKPAP